MSFAYAGTTTAHTEYPSKSYGNTYDNSNRSRGASDYTARAAQQPPTRMMHSQNSQSYAQHSQSYSQPPARRRDGSLAFDINYYLLPKNRLNTLFAVHAFFSLLIGTLGYIRPSFWTYLFFSTESDREFGVARAVLRLYCSLIAAQGVMIWRARRINDGEIKRAFVQAYFLCFLFSSLALVAEHMGNEGVVSGKFFGIVKIVVVVALTGGYGWFTFFQPPTVFALQSHYS